MGTSALKCHFIIFEYLSAMFIFARLYGKETRCIYNNLYMLTTQDIAGDGPQGKYKARTNSIMHLYSLLFLGISIFGVYSRMLRESSSSQNV